MKTFDNADIIARHIIERTSGRIRLALPLGLGKANTIANALTRAALEDSSIELRIFTALTLERPVPRSELEKRLLEPALDRLFGRYPALHYAELLHANELPANIEISEFFLLAGKWLGVERAQRNYISANYTHALHFLLERQPNVLAQLLARDGNQFSLSCNTDISADLPAARRNGEADFLLAGEANGGLPFMADASAQIGEDEVDCLLDGPGTGFELFSSVKRPVGLVEQAIGLHVSGLVRDGGTLQIGIGSIGDAVAHALLLRHRDNGVWKDVQIANPFTAGGIEGRSETFEIGLYASTEMLVDGLLQLFDADVIKREVDGAAIHAGFFVGSRVFYDKLRTMPPQRRAKIVMKPVSFTNQLYGDEQARRDARRDACFVNNAMMATLLGAVVSDQTADGQVVSGVGGQFNFVTQAFALRGARSVITVEATRDSGGKTVSNIVWNHAHTTIPRHLKDIVVSEYGIADLRGKSDAETIAALLAITDSRFQDQLLDQAKAQGKIARDHRIAAAHRNNTPQRLREWLRPHREIGVLPRFPFGTDFSDAEQRLLPALSMLKTLRHSWAGLLRLALHGLPASGSPQARECLVRMGLDAPWGVKELVYALLLRGALAQAEAID